MIERLVSYSFGHFVLLHVFVYVCVVQRPSLGQVKILQAAALSSPNHMGSVLIVLVGSQVCQNGTRITPNVHGRIFIHQICISESGLRWGRLFCFFCIFAGFFKTVAKQTSIIPQKYGKNSFFPFMERF